MITIVISSYKYGHLASHCIETVLGQSVVPEKIIFVDDGAQDCWDLQYMYPEIECVLRPTNIGTIANFQDMLSRIQTEYCMFIGADNWLRSDAIELLLSKVNSSNADIVTYDMVLTGSEKLSRIKYHAEEIIPYLGDYYWSRDHKHHGSMLYRAKLAQRVGGYAKYGDLRHTCEDLTLWDRMMAAGAKVSHISEALLYYRHHRENFNKY